MTEERAVDRKAEIEALLARERAGRGRRVWVWAALALALVLAGGWFWASRGGGAGETAYRTALAERTDLRVTVTATGTVEPTSLVEVSSELSGTLEEVLVDFNDRVRSGQELARLDTTKLEAERAVAEANVTSAQAQLYGAQTVLSEAREEYDSAVVLDERGTISHQALIERRTAYNRALAEVTMAEANLDLARARLKVVEADLAKACICSPVDGVVLDRAADKGQIVAASFSAPVLFTIAEDLTQLEVQVAIDEADIGVVEEGQRAVFTVEAHDERSFPARIRTVRYAPQMVEGVVSYTAVLSVENEDLALRPGMTATAEVIVSDIEDVLTVPNAALRYAPPHRADTENRGGGLLGLLMPGPPETGSGLASGRAVWVLRDGRPVEVPVETGATDGRRTEIVEGDLRDGDPVVIAEEG